LHLTRAADLLELDLPEPDLSVYHRQSPSSLDADSTHEK